MIVCIIVLAEAGGLILGGYAGRAKALELAERLSHAAGDWVFTLNLAIRVRIRDPMLPPSVSKEIASDAIRDVNKRREGP